MDKKEQLDKLICLLQQYYDDRGNQEVEITHLSLSILDSGIFESKEPQVTQHNFINETGKKIKLKDVGSFVKLSEEK